MLVVKMVVDGKNGTNGKIGGTIGGTNGTNGTNQWYEWSEMVKMVRMVIIINVWQRPMHINHASMAIHYVSTPINHAFTHQSCV